MRKVILALLTLGLIGGVASADRGRDRGWRDHRDSSSSWSGGVRVSPQHRTWSRGTVWRDNDRPRWSHRAHVVRRPIYVQRPIIKYRYYNYYQRPSVLVENYPAMTGYIWVAGAWSWNGYEWMWQPGHYEPDPNYVDNTYYDNSYDSGYYDSDSGYYYNNGY